MEKQLIIDEAYEVDAVILEEINESTGKNEKNYYIEGIFSTIEKRNRNGRVYPRKIWESNITKYQNEIKDNTYKTLGELEHPARVEVDPMKAVIKIQKLWVENDFVKGRAKILNDNSPETNKLKALIDEGLKIGVSSRGTGRLGKSNIVEDFELQTYDVVARPSDYNAMLQGLTESIEKGIEFDESLNKYVCTDGHCELKESVNEDEKCCKDSIDNVIKAFEDYAAKPEIAKKEADEKALKSKFEEHFGKTDINESTPKGYIQRLLVTKNDKESVIKPADWLDVHLYSKEDSVTQIRIQYSKGDGGGVDLGKSTVYKKRPDGVWLRIKHKGKNTRDIVVFKSSKGQPYVEIVGKA
jgi:hypothetical protein